jgi:uncharacterized protein (TIGR00369 family)
MPMENPITMQHALPNFWPGNCFACSPHNPHGLRMQFQKSGEGCHASVSLPAHLCGMEGVAHGGIVATLLDETAAWTLVAHAGRLALTTEMNIRFVKPVPLGRELTAGARILSRDDKRAQTQASVTTPDGTVLAQADASWTLLTAALAARMTGLDRTEIERYIASIFNH